MADFQQDCLQAHNTKRALHSVPTLSLASDLSAHAYRWAEHLAASDSTIMQNSDLVVNGQRVGESIACKTDGSDYTGTEVVDEWYSEIKNYNYQSEETTGSGHFSQIVWKDTKELGVGKAKTSSGKCIVVCNYRPTGNVRGAFRDNVFPPK